MAFADDNRFAVVTLNNNTNDVPVSFSYRWGNGDWKVLNNLKPGRAECFSMLLDNAGNAPQFQIKINEAIGANTTPVVKTWTLKWKAAPDKEGKFGHQYEILRDKSDNKYIFVNDRE